jgi:alanine-glyoxylate transaminase/serine-glyoxylate transaminase/serine-pyruvate transaminase
VDEAKVRKEMLDGPGIEIAGGLGPLAGKIFRIGVMGPLATEDNVQFFLKEFSKALGAAGYSS